MAIPVPISHALRRVAGQLVVTLPPRSHRFRVRLVFRRGETRMRRSRLGDEQIIAILKEYAVGLGTPELSRAYGISVEV